MKGFVSKILIAILILLVASFVLPIFNMESVNTLLTATTFLFGVLYGFEISVVITNFVSLKTQLAIENAGVRSIWHLADIMGGDTGEEIKRRIEQYLFAVIDYPLKDHLETDMHYFSIFEPLKTMSADPDTAAKGQALQYLNEGIYYIPQARNQVADVAPRFVNKAEWAMLIILALFLVAALFITRDATLFSKITTAAFSTAVVGALILLDDIDSNRIMEAYLEYGMFNDTLKSLGKEPYYPEFAFKSGVIKIPNGKYRVGIFPKLPSLAERTIETRG